MSSKRKGKKDEISISLLFAAIFFIIAGAIFYFMYPTLQKSIEIQSKIDASSEEDSLLLKVEKTAINTKLLYYGSGVILAIVLSVFSLMCYFDFNLGSTCHYD